MPRKRFKTEEIIQNFVKKSCCCLRARALSRPAVHGVSGHAIAPKTRAIRQQAEM